MRVKFSKTVTYKQATPEGKIDEKSPIFEAGKEYDLDDSRGFASRWIRRGVADEVKAKGKADVAEPIAKATEPTAKK